MTPDEIESAHPIDRASTAWREAFASLPHNPEQARRLADLRARSATLAAAKASGATGVFPDGLGAFVAIRDGVDYPASSTVEAATVVLDATAPDAADAEARSRAQDDEIARLRKEIRGLRGALATARNAAPGRSTDR